MSARIGLGLILSIVFLASCSPSAPDETPAPDTETAGAAESDGPIGEKRAAFDALFVEWKALLSRLNDLGLRHQVADPSEKVRKKAGAAVEEIRRQIGKEKQPETLSSMR